MQDNISLSLQENLIVLLVYNDEHCKTVRNLVPHNLFEGAYFEIVRRVHKFIDTYGKPPKEHLIDLFADILEGDDSNRKEMYEEILDEIQEFQDKVQVDFTLQSIKDFIAKQELKKGVLKAAELLQSEEEDAVEKARSVLTASAKEQGNLFDPGTRLLEFHKSLRFLDDEEEKFHTGVQELDKRSLCPARKQLFLFIGLAKAGKTTFLASMARRTLQDGHKVLHISLEMSEDRMSSRYFSNILGISKRKEKFKLSEFERDSNNKLVDIIQREIEPKLSYSDPNIRSKIIKGATTHERWLKNLLIKEFPTSTLSVSALKGYLDMLENTGFVPDLLIVDYPDLMKLPSDDSHRIALGQVFKELRGIAVERNLGLAVVSQSNREGTKKKKLTDANVAEDWSKIATADTIITYNQSEGEREMGLARIYVSNARNDQDKITILITQNYAMSQFCRDSYLMDADVFKLIEGDDLDDI